MDRRGITIFGAVVVGVVLAVQVTFSFPGILGAVGLRAPGFPFNLPLLWVPALAAFLAAGLAGDHDHPRLEIWPVPWKPVLVATFGIPLVFASIGAVWVAAHWARVDRELATFVAELPSDLGATRWTSGQLTALTGFALALSMVLGPTLFALVWLGGEIGWRDYLLPKLLPLGRMPAYLISGSVWGLWMAWLDVFPKESPAFLPVLRYMLWGVAMGTVLSEVRRRSGSVGLAAIVSGIYSAQAAGVWPHLFVWRTDSALLGATGFVSIAVWGVIAAVLCLWPGAREEKSTAR